MSADNASPTRWRVRYAVWRGGQRALAGTIVYAETADDARAQVVALERDASNLRIYAVERES